MNGKTRSLEVFFLTLIMLLSTQLFFLKPSAAQTTIVKIIDATRGTTNINFTSASPPPTAPDYPLGYVLVNVTIVDVVGMVGWMINITWNADLLQIANGDLFIPFYDHVFTGYEYHTGVQDIGSTYAVWFAEILEAKTFTGSGTLCQIRFNVTKAPAEGETLTTDIHLVQMGEYPIWTYLIDMDALDILYTPEDGLYEYSYVPPPIGDVNGDYVIDAKDYQLVKRSVPSMPISPNWNPDADLDSNGVVDGRDFLLVKKSMIKSIHG